MGNASGRFIVKQTKTVCDNKVYDSELRLAVSFPLLEAKNDVLEKFCTNTLNSDYTIHSQLFIFHGKVSGNFAFKKSSLLRGSNGMQH